MSTYGFEGTRPRTTGHDRDCACPACDGLRTSVRPRFFAGQLLTETDLGALVGYVQDKQRLHNRYLHGYGVVCGLQVECDGCGPGVLVRPGYALDQCGNDLVLPDSASIDVAKLISACSRPAKADDCDPPRYPRAEGCNDREQTWCLWMRYKEQPSRPVTPLGGGSPDCGCGSAGKAPRTATSTEPDCGCGGRARRTRSADCGCAEPPRQTSRPAGCEPSRVYEYVEFGVARKECSCDDDLSTALGGTFPAKVVECITHLQPVLTSGMGKNMQSAALSVVTGGEVGLTTGTARDALCQLYANVLNLYRNDPMRTQCVLPEELSQLDCSPQGQNETDAAFRSRIAYGLQQLVMLVLLYLRDCVCYAVLPPCPGPACDDRVVLACVTVVDGVVQRICNHSCRRYAGSFVNREYWLPIGPVLSLLAAKLCCFPLGLGRRDQLRERAVTEQPNAAAAEESVRRPVSLNRADQLLGALRADDFALIGLWRQRAKQAATRLRAGSLLEGVERSLSEAKGSVRLASALHSDVADTVEKLRKKGVEVTVVEVEDTAEGLSFDAIPRVSKGGAATLYAKGGIVVGVRGSEGLNPFGGAR